MRAGASSRRAASQGSFAGHSRPRRDWEGGRVCFLFDSECVRRVGVQVGRAREWALWALSGPRGLWEEGGQSCLSRHHDGVITSRHDGS